MKKFRFSLDRMRDYREQLLEEEKNTLSRLNAARDQIQGRIEFLGREFARISREMLREQAEGTQISKLRAYDTRLDSIRRQQKQLRAELEQAQRKVDAQMGVVLAASQEVSKLDKLEERQLEEYKKDAAKEEELFISELVSSDSIRKQIS